MSEWIKCSTAMPDDGCRVLVYEPWERVKIAWHGDPPEGYSYPPDHHKIWWGHGDEMRSVTHWMPLPTPPPLADRAQNP